MPDRILLPLIVASALFMENLDSTVLSTALPAIAADFGVSPLYLKLALTSYLLALAIFIPASGWLADRFGARLVFRLAIATFTIGSIWCGLSESIAELVAARIVQGLGGSMMVPVGRLIVLRSVEKHELVGSLAWLTIPALIGPLMGPPVGGFITTFFDWRWIFWINVPVGILGLILATLYVPDIRGEGVGAFDTRGFLLSGLGLAFFMSGSTILGLDLMPAAYVIAMLVAGALLLAGYVVYSRSAPNPIIDLTLFRIPTFWISTMGTMLFRVGVGATPFLLPLLLQVGFGMTPFRSGMITFSAAIGAVVMKFIATPILWLYGFRAVLVTNAIISAVFVSIPAAFTMTTPIWIMVGVLLAGGFSRSLQFTSVSALAFADIETRQLSKATAITSVAQQLALTIGISVGATVVQIASIGQEAITAEAFAPAFIVVGLIVVASVFFFLRLTPDAGHQVSRHRRYAPDAVTVMRER
ncbi:MFS transporter [Bauldia sp.]|uniref:MFS transporter n=1 Tax=Bauldia sp. TaxID=2575872 RepID=UPI003BAA6625